MAGTKVIRSGAVVRRAEFLEALAANLEEVQKEYKARGELMEAPAEYIRGQVVAYRRAAKEIRDAIGIYEEETV